MSTNFCLLYTSDAADDLLCVDLGGRRIIKKKRKKEEINASKIYSPSGKFAERAKNAKKRSAYSIQYRHIKTGISSYKVHRDVIHTYKAQQIEEILLTS